MANVGGLIFGSNQPAIDYAADNTTYTMGTLLKSDVDTKIVQLHWRVPNDQPGHASNLNVLPIQAYLWHRPTTLSPAATFELVRTL